MLQRFLLLVGILLSHTPTTAQLIINEFSNGTGGGKEFFEFVVTGTPGTTQDIRGWIFDDHTGLVSCSNGKGIAPGHARFSSHTSWKCIPVGSIILVYNPGDPNSNISVADDYTDINKDYIYVLPLSANGMFDINQTNPVTNSCHTFTGGFLSPSNPWQTVALGNSRDAVTLVDPANQTVAHHLVSYNLNSGSVAPVNFTGSGGGKNFSFVNTTGNDWNLISNWTSGSAGSNDTPGQFNSTANQQWIESLRIEVSAVVSATGCSPVPVDLSANGNDPSSTYSWDFGDGSTGTGAMVTHTYSTGTYAAILTITNALGCVLKDTVDVTVVGGNPPLITTVADQCLNAPPVSLIATPAGGTFSGPGVIGSQFDPASAGIGTHTISYTTSGTCSSTATITITVINQPVVTINSIPDQCISGTAITLIGVPQGGTFSGPGVLGSQFDPTNAGVGTHTITYTSPGLCSGTATTTVNVNNSASLTFAAIPDQCLSNASVNLSASPTGGVFSGPGVSGSQFDPATAGIGTHTLTYTLSGSCGGTITSTVNVLNQPAVSISTIADQCLNSSAITLSATPAGGVFSGPGILGTQFDPSTAGVGTHTITYTVGGTCGGTTTSTVAVLNQSTVSISSIANQCISGGAITLLATPSGGTFSGPGVSGANFDPAIAGVGTHTITYSLGGNCGGTATTNVTVVNQPSINILAIADQCLTSGSIALTATPSGGMFSGPGVTGGLFDPAVAGVGTHTIAYAVGGACGGTATTLVTVSNQPSVSISNVSSQCVNNGAISLSATPLGGTFSGSGVSGNQFNPAIAGIGTHTITYTVGGTCGGSATTTIAVTGSAVIAITPVVDQCVSNNQVQLNATPMGGVFSGLGVSGNLFDPSIAGVGSHTITYTVSGACGNTATTNILVSNTPNVQINGIPDVCVSGSSVGLVGSPSGGVFSGSGVSGGQFDPSVAGVGTHTINYAVGGACGGNASTTITVNNTSTLTFNPIPDQCISGPVVHLNASPSGGTFSGPGVTGNQFDPLVAGVGTHTLVYAIPGACGGNVSTTVNVSNLPYVAISGVGTLCTSGSAIGLSAIPAGGTFVGPGVNGNQFDPAIAGVGTHTITYTVSGTCTGSATRNISVTTAPSVQIDPIPNQCNTGGPIPLTATPSGGTFSGAGVSGNQFDPSVAGAGTHTITYTVNGSCGGVATTSVLVVPSVPISITPLANQCVSGTAVTLQAMPSGGTFSGNGVSNGQFDPSVAGVGTHTISYTKGGSCKATVTTTVTVVAEPIISITPIPSQCISGNNFTMSATPAGGVFSGNGVVGNQFDPSVAGVGFHMITYTVNGICTVHSMVQVQVKNEPNVAIYSVQDQCVTNVPVQLNSTPQGGTFSGPGVLGNQFDPATAGVGSHQIFYTVSGTCTKTVSRTINVLAAPSLSISSVPDLCETGSSVALSGQPVGGTFSGIGVNGNQFDPTLSGSGNHVVTYTVSGACVAQKNKTIKVIANPTVLISPVADICNTSNSVALTAIPAGGTFSGNGVIGNQFDPAQAGVGNHTLTYTHGTVCTNQSTTSVTVINTPTIVFNPIADQCIGDVPVTLSGLPTGGVFSGAGVSGNQFDPSLAGAGQHTLTYTKGGLCGGSATVVVEVFARPTVSIDPVADLCPDNVPVALTGSPSGGAFSGSGMSGSQFSPSIANVGNHVVNYSVIVGGGACVVTASTNILVHPLPTPSIDPLPSIVCSNEASLLVSASPIGGSFSSNVSTANLFDPSLQGVGSHQIIYTLTQQCTASDTISIQVQGAPSISITAQNTVCENASGVFLSAQPLGGMFSGNSVVGNYFDPTGAIPGDNTVYYQWSDAVCQVLDSVIVHVDTVPQAVITPIPDLCENDLAVGVQASIVGGSFSGVGIVNGNEFDPGVSGPGLHTIHYQVSVGSCTGNTQAFIRVLANPQPTFQMEDIICKGDVFFPLPAGSPAGGIVQGPGIVGGSINLQNITGVGTEVYSYTVTVNGCEGTAYETVMFVDSPSISLNLIGDTVICDGEYAQLQVTGGVNYQWNTGHTSNSIKANQTGWYACEVGHNCGVDTVSQFIQVHPKPSLGLAVDTPVVCASKYATITANYFGELNWDNGAITDSIVTNVPGVYRATVSNICGEVSAQIELIEDKVYGAFDYSYEPDLDQFSVSFNNQSNEVQYLWDFGDGDTISTVEHPNHTYSDYGDYLVELTAINALGCRATVSKWIEVIKDLKVFIPSAFTPNGDQLNDNFQVIVEGEYTYFEGVIFNRWGEEMIRLNSDEEVWDGTSKGREASNDTYVYRVLIDGEEYTGKIQLIR